MIPPAHPIRRVVRHRLQSVLFWSMLLLFVALLGFLGLLAFSAGYSPSFSGTDIHLHRIAEIIVALLALAALTGAIIRRDRKR